MPTDDDREREIRAIAYDLWEQDGQPEGQEARHWDAAKEIWAARSGDADGQPVARDPVPSGTPDDPATAGFPDGEPVLAIENQAIPTALGDQEGRTKAPRRSGSVQARGGRKA